jgi:hypothetical protein
VPTPPVLMKAVRATAARLTKFCMRRAAVGLFFITNFITILLATILLVTTLSTLYYRLLFVSTVSLRISNLFPYLPSRIDLRLLRPGLTESQGYNGSMRIMFSARRHISRRGPSSAKSSPDQMREFPHCVHRFGGEEVPVRSQRQTLPPSETFMNSTGVGSDQHRFLSD